jgi:16S rRNA A1518/A1519 N6-dimethyltransferase RsmA/KsgA/DIM1 with predicted DNA glycosylase/AP lyase activity
LCLLAALHLERNERGLPLIHNADRQCFRDFVVHIFTDWKPTLKPTLKSIFTRQQLKDMNRALGIDLDGTPTSLSFEQWLNLFQYSKVVGNKGAMQVIVGSEKRLIQQQNGLQKRRRTR